MKQLIIFLLIFSNLVVQASSTEIADLNSIFKTNWTHTYLKAEEGKADLMKEYIIKNWFVMDEVAVQQGLFRNYHIITNQQSQQDTSWDLIVAVEYYADESYTNIATSFEKIRTAHKVHAVTGLNRGDFKVIKSELVSVEDKYREPLACPIENYQILKPFLGFWEYIDTSNEDKNSYGNLEFRISSLDCSTVKQARFYESNTGYISQGRYDANENKWIESYSTGVEFEWRNINGETFMYNISSQLPDNNLRRNQWESIDKDRVKIIEQYSKDNGTSWETRSITELHRR